MKNMIKFYTIGTNGKTCKSFFELIKNNGIDIVIDIRLNYKSQLSGFAKGGDDFLGYLLTKICHIEYVHDFMFAPTEAILTEYHNDHDWHKYEIAFNALLKERRAKDYFYKKYNNYQNVCFLCVEKEPIQCHRRLVSEYITNDSGKVTHL